MAIEVPSAFFLGDVFLMIDAQFQGNLITCNRESKQDTALIQGERLRSLVSYLRLLFRKSDTSKDAD